MDGVGNMVVTSCLVITPQLSPTNLVDERDEVGHIGAMTIKRIHENYTFSKKKTLICDSRPVELRSTGSLCTK